MATPEAVGIIYYDFLTISSGNLIGLCGAGDRSQSLGTYKLVQGQMIYSEYCYDTEFHDATSTATFSTVTNDITFTAGQVWLSSVIDLGTTLSQIKVELGTLVGSVLIEISSDNKSTWQTVTADVLTTVSSSDGLGTFVRITENAAGAATIDLTLNSINVVTEPVVKITMVE